MQIYRRPNELEVCPGCKSIFIQYDKVHDQCYCLDRTCNYRWEEDIDVENSNNIKNDYLRISIKHSIA